MITEDNWNYSFYKNGRMQVGLSLVGTPMGEGVETRYALTLTDETNKEYFQRDFKELAEAIEDANIRYSHWTFSLRDEQKDDEGCSSCQAH